MKPHDPFIAPKKYFDMYPPESLKLWRDPLIIAAPGMRGGQVSRSLVEFVDLYPTVADLCGIKLLHKVAGLSLRPVLESPATQVKDAAYTLVTRGPKLSEQSIRTARWRFTRWSDNQIELYNHERDPEEFRNVAGENPDIVKSLSEQLQNGP